MLQERSSTFVSAGRGGPGEREKLRKIFGLMGAPGLNQESSSDSSAKEEVVKESESSEFEDEYAKLRPRARSVPAVLKPFVLPELSLIQKNAFSSCDLALGNLRSEFLVLDSRPLVYSRIRRQLSPVASFRRPHGRASKRFPDVLSLFSDDLCFDLSNTKILFSKSFPDLRIHYCFSSNDLRRFQLSLLPEPVLAGVAHMSEKLSPSYVVRSKIYRNSHTKALITETDFLTLDFLCRNVEFEISQELISCLISDLLDAIDHIFGALLSDFSFSLQHIQMLGRPKDHRLQHRFKLVDTFLVNHPRSPNNLHSPRALSSFPTIALSCLKNVCVQLIGQARGHVFSHPHLLLAKFTPSFLDLVHRLDTASSMFILQKRVHTQLVKEIIHRFNL